MDDISKGVANTPAIKEKKENKKRESKMSHRTGRLQGVAGVYRLALYCGVLYTEKT
jgi:hypothetical protein